MDKSFLENISENDSVYSFLSKRAILYKEETAISFYGIRISYKCLFSKIDEVAKALIACGVKKDDVIASSLPGCPEGIYLLYAINKIGAIYCAFDCRSKNKEIKETIKTFSPKLCFVPDFQLRECRDIQDCSLVFMSPAHALGGMEKLYSIPANFFTGRTFICAKNSRILSYDQFIQKAENGQLCTSQKSGQDIFGYFYTSGTTYGRKSVILTNENINAAAIIQKQGNPMIKRGQTLLNIMPLFTCYSITLAVHLPLISGVTVSLIPLLDTKKMKKILLKEQPNYIITVPAHWEYFVHNRFHNCDLSFMKGVIVGGDTMVPTYREKLCAIFKDHGAGSPIIIGYGLSETTSTAVAAFSAPEKSVGHALPHMQISICHPETGEQLRYGEEGEICICGPTVCKGYFKDEEMTRSLLRKHEDGKIWLHSGDRGYMDSTGALFFCERYKRMYVRFDGTKVSPYSIEQVISACPLVEACLAVAIPDKGHSHGMCAKVFIVLRNGIHKATATAGIQKYCKRHLDEHMLPDEIAIVDRLPKTRNGKLAYFEEKAKAGKGTI